ncbi:MAG: glycosyltransferase family 4 protein [Candidatus Rokubacteria bacterium]|nr:glycosyltransferase family 4 protein [Candidatus Rokubacteria bacterium]
MRLTIFWLSYQYDRRVRCDMGGFRATWEKAEALGRRGHRVIVFCPRLTRTPEETSAEVVRLPFLDLPGLRPLLVQLLFLVSALWTARAARPDLIYVTGGLSPAPLLLARLLRRPLIFELNGDSAHHAELGGHRVRAAWARAFYRSILPRADFVAAVSEELGRVLRNRYGLPAEKIRVLPNGANLEQMRPVPPALARERIGLEPDRPTVGFAGTFFGYQGLQTLIEAAPSILERCPRALFLLVGDGEMRPAWEGMVRAKGLSAAFRFTGQVPYRQVPLCINAMDVALAPMVARRGPTSPLKLFDYWACARPVVASDLPDLAELIRESRAAMAVPPDDPHALADAVSELLADQAKRYALGTWGRRFVEARYSWAHVAERMEGLFLEAIRNWGRR